MQQNENGRTMIEMLGVLAIIGVLSVMGIAGYQKAVSKYYINRTIQNITQMVQHTRIVFGSQKDYSGLGTGDEIANVMFSADLAPKDMLTLDQNGEYVKPYVFKNKYKGIVSMRASDRAVEGDNMAFIIRFEQLPKNACIDVATSAWGGTNGNGYVALVINPKSEEPETDDLRTTNCVTTPLTQKNKAVHCTGHGIMLAAAAAGGCFDRPQGNTIEIKFY